MKKLITIALVVVMAFALFVGAKTAYAALLSYDSSIQVQNLEATPASITISFYARDGSSVLSVTDTVDASSSNTYFPLQNIGNEGRKCSGWIRWLGCSLLGQTDCRSHERGWQQRLRLRWPMAPAIEALTAALPA